MRWLLAMRSWLVRTIRRSPCGRISTSVFPLLRSASCLLYARICLCPLIVTSCVSAPEILMLPRGFSNTTRFMPAAGPLAETG